VNSLTTERTETVFAYGTLRERDIQIAVFGRSTDGVSDTLDGHRLDRINLGGSVYPIAYPVKGAFIRGIRYAVTASELILIDAYEGREYARITVRLRSGMAAWVYIAHYT
jgi:gamma-glutamylcyclotransferase (GGCT)/AIG2-like uncharacterized protein YtfP